MRLFSLLLVTLLIGGCMTFTYGDLNLTPSPYTSVVRIEISTDQRAAGSMMVGPGLIIRKDASVIIRDRETSDTYTIPVRLNAIRARLGQGQYQVLGLEASKTTSGQAIGLVMAAGGPGTKRESTESRIEFAVLPADLGKEVVLGSYDPIAQTVSGNRLSFSK